MRNLSALASLAFFAVEMKNTLQQHYGNRDRCFAEQYLPIHLPLEVQGTHMFNSPSLFLHRERRQEVQGTNGLPPHLMSVLKEAVDEACLSFAKLLEDFRSDLLIYDFL
nr:beta-D-glucosyl crocetin beta-1,6-glucosyltransferase-like [Ipomoea batatas]GMD03639.1 beta-D-glucosyl crocetin beta-1,6-glucosyltransferase-like [Ipomoea batatas]